MLLISSCATRHSEFIAYCETDEWKLGGFAFRDDWECYSVDTVYPWDYTHPLDRLIEKHHILDNEDDM